MKEFISKNKKVIRIILIILGTIILAVATSFIVFKPKNNNNISEEPIKNEEQQEEKVNANIVYYLDNNKIEKMPNNGYKYISASCDNGANITFNQEKWTYDITNVTSENTVCNIYFENDIKKRNVIFNYNGGKGDITSKQVQVGGSIGELPTPTYENHKFLGWYTEADGGELIWFSHEMEDKDITLYAHYETLGSFDDVINKMIKENKDLVKVGNDYRFVGKNPDNYVDVPGYGLFRIIGIFDGDVKVISEYPQGQQRQWHSDYEDDDSSSNKWKYSDLYDYLNKDFYNGMTSDFKNVVKKHDWYIGKASENETAKTLYENEQSEKVNANLGLMSASDYAYAAGEKCWEDEVVLYSKSCNKQDWLYGDRNEWTITPSSEKNRYAIYIGKIGFAEGETLTKEHYYRVALYLVDGLKVTNMKAADGTSNNPYQLSK